MRHVAALNFAIFLILFTSIGSTAAVVELADQQAPIPVKDYTFFYEDTSSNLQIEEIIALDKSDAFQSIAAPSINFGFKDHTYWLKIPVRNTSDQATDWIIDLGHMRMVDYGAYLHSGTTTQKLAEVVGSDPISARQIEHRLLLASFTLLPQQTATLYVKYHSYGNTYVKPVLSPPSVFYLNDAFDAMALNLIFGAIALLVIYFLILAIILRSDAYLAYTVFLLIGLIHLFHQAGFTSFFVWPETQKWNAAANFIGFPGIIAAAIFAQRFLDLRNTDKPFYHASQLIVVMALASTVWCIVERPPFVSHVGYGLSGLITIVNFIATVRAYRRGFKAARFAILGWGGLLLIACYTTLSLWGLVPAVSHGHWMHAIGLITESFFFSISLADRVAEMRQSRDKIQKDLIASLEIQAATSKAAARDAIEKSAAMAESVAKGRALSAVGHDVRQPLHALRLYAQGIKNKSTSKHTHDGLQQMEKAISSLEELLNSALDSSTPESNGDFLVEERFSAERVMSALRLVFAPAAEEKGLDLKICTSTQVLYSDWAVVLRIMNNLVSNAVRYTDKGKILIGCRRRGNSIAFQVLDTGCGIPEGLLETVFDPYNQLSPDELNKQGHGLGLAIVKHLADRIEAEVTIKSTPGKGTCAELLIPTGFPVADDKYTNTQGEHLLANFHALIIDDDQLSLQQLEKQLTSFGMNTVSGTTLTDCLDKLSGSDWVPDILICDLHLANASSGVDTIIKTRKHFEQNTPAFVVTFDRNKSVHEQVQANPNTWLIYKPVDTSILKSQLIKKALPHFEKTAKPH